MTIPTTEPKAVRAGDTIQWQRSLPDYPASDGWALKYHLRNATLAAIDINAAASGDDHLVTVTAADSANYADGEYGWQARVEKGAEKFTVDTGEIMIEPDLSAATNHDTRSYAQKTLDAIEAVLAKRATKDQQNYAIEGRSLVRMPIADLLVFRDQFKREVSRERRAARVAKGLGTGDTIGVRFGGG